MTEHAGGITIQQLKNEMEPVRVSDLCEGSIAETAKALKNTLLLMQFVEGIEGSDEDTQDAIDHLKCQIAETRVAILSNALARNTELETQFSKLLIAVDYLIDLVSPEELASVSRALVTP